MRCSQLAGWRGPSPGLGRLGGLPLERPPGLDRLGGLPLGRSPGLDRLGGLPRGPSPGRLDRPLGAPHAASHDAVFEGHSTAREMSRPEMIGRALHL